MSTACYRGSIANTFTGFTNTTKQGLTEDDVRRIVREELARTPPHGWLHKDAEDEIKRLRDMLAQLPQHGSGRAARIALDALPTLLDEVERLRAMLSAAGCMMPTASGFIQLDTNDRAALDAAIDADMDGEPDDRQ